MQNPRRAAIERLVNPRGWAIPYAQNISSLLVDGINIAKVEGVGVTLSFFQVAPPSSVRKTVLPEPLAQATRSFTALTPRRRALTLLVCTVHCGVCTKSEIMIASKIVKMIHHVYFFCGSLFLCGGNY